MIQGPEFPADSVLRHIKFEFADDDGLINGMLSPIHVLEEEMPVSEARVIELREDMARIRATGRGLGEGTGQDSRITLGEVPNEPKLLIIDGFHRYQSFLVPEAPDMKVVAVPGLTMEELLDKRVVAGTVHSDLSFARTVLSIEAAWQLTDWAELLTASQAFVLTHNDSKYTRDENGSPLRFGPEVITGIKDWARAKSERWQIPLSTIMRRLVVAQKAELDEVQQVRAKERSGTARGIVTATMLDELTTAFPDNPTVRRRLERLVTQHDLDGFEVREIITRLAQWEATDPDETEAILLDPDLVSSIRRAQRIVSNPRGKRKPSVSSTTAEDSERVPEQSAGVYNTLLTEFLRDEIELAHLSLQALVLRGVYVSDRLPLDSSGNASPVDGSVLTVDDSAFKAMAGGSSRKRKHAIRARFEDRRAELVNRLQTGENERTAAKLADILNTVEARLSLDSRHGGLHFVEVGRNDTLDALIIACLQDEIQVHDKTIPSPQAPMTHPMSGQALVEGFPSIERGVRRMIILRSVFNLSPFVVAQVVEQNDKDIDPAIMMALNKI